MHRIKINKSIRAINIPMSKSIGQRLSKVFKGTTSDEFVDPGIDSPPSGASDRVEGADIQRAACGCAYNDKWVCINRCTPCAKIRNLEQRVRFHREYILKLQSEMIELQRFHQAYISGIIQPGDQKPNRRSSATK